MAGIDVGFKTEEPFKELDVAPGDLTLGSVVFGFFIGFTVHVTRNAIQETMRSRRFSAYIFMIWLEITANVGLAILAWGYLAKKFPPGLGVFAPIIACWISQVQCLMLIIVNRLCILYSDRRQRRKLRFFAAGVVTTISLSTACIWIPAQLQINHTYVWLNHWWDRFEKGVYLLLDLSLNLIFIRVVKTRLVDYGLKKYDKVMKFNEYIIFLSIGMDILLLGATTLHNGFVYVQFHPVTYIVKLQIEITMSRLLVKVARSTGINVYSDDTARMTSETLSTKTITSANDMQVLDFTGRQGDDFEMSSMNQKKIPHTPSTNSLKLSRG